MFRIKFRWAGAIIVASLFASSVRAADQTAEAGGYTGAADTGIGANPLATPSSTPPGVLGIIKPGTTSSNTTEKPDSATNNPYGTTTPPGAGNYGSQGSRPGNSSNPSG